MRIAMFTNTYLPQIGGVAQSVARFTAGYRRLGHPTVVVAPAYQQRDGGLGSTQRFAHTGGRMAAAQDDATAACEDETGDVVRVPALRRFKGSDFSFAVPAACDLNASMDSFDPDIVHAHHPFLLGTEAARVAAARDVPLVFTHHTMYEWYTHYVPLEIPSMRTFIRQLATGYANLCDCVFAPSASVGEILRRRGVESPVRTVPTGVDVERFASGRGRAFRRRDGVPPDALLIGHVGRLAAEKNLAFLADAVIRAMRDLPQARAAWVGSGPLLGSLQRRFTRAGMAERAHFLGSRSGQDLVDAYDAMDVFVFASKTETQGMVLAEALAAGCPCVALDAPGAREVVADGRAGRLVRDEDVEVFAAAVREVAEEVAGGDSGASQVRERARAAAEPFSDARCIDRALAAYEEIVASDRKRADIDRSDWAVIARAIKREWDIWSNRVGSLGQVAREKLDSEGFTTPR
ncbi:MAG: glycosyltransferase [Planctomycetota bacterium]